jgi:hypothetical protein
MATKNKNQNPKNLPCSHDNIIQVPFMFGHITI